MSKIEVDPKLFITCRLCLEESGTYQIDPTVKEQILYCFEINVEPFDGLPQLICKKCESILSNFSSTKRKIIQKQNDLKNKIQGNINGQLTRPTQGTTSSSRGLEFEDCGIKDDDIFIKTTKKRKRLISSSSSESESDNNNRETAVVNNDKEPVDWSEAYTKQYVCRLCKSQKYNKRSLICHLNTHNKVKNKFRHVFDKCCKIQLYKIDDRHNFTGSENNVVHSKEKVIRSSDANYYILYTPLGINENELSSSPEENEKTKLSAKRKTNSTEDSDDRKILKRQKKRNYSSSSNETVVLDTENKSNISDNVKKSKIKRKAITTAKVSECINIDSSDSEPETTKAVTKDDIGKQAPVVVKKETHSMNTTNIDDIVLACKNKYMKKHFQDILTIKSDKNPNNISFQLRRKILSIGRKIINKNNSVNCTPLLKFLDHKNLDIMWLPRSLAYITKESNYVRVMTRTRHAGDDVGTENGWVEYMPPTENVPFIDKLQSDVSNSAEVDVSIKTSLATATRKESNHEPNDSNHQITEYPETPVVESAVLYTETSANAIDTKKLLNKNPVANPKQLPKKSNETKVLKVIPVMPTPSVNKGVDESDENNFCMPIIMSTTSLAFSEKNKITSDNSNESNFTKNYDNVSDAPRIKVKPVSELMSKETLSRMNAPIQVPRIVTLSQQTHLQNDNINVFIPNMSMSQVQSNIQENNSLSNVVDSTSQPDQFVILDTVEFPNTKTTSPYQYFRSLLQVHNIILLETDAELAQDYSCLVKFKVLYNQESKGQPVVLFLALFCFKNAFCLKVKDRNQKNINMSKISANWQWEILKIFTGDVVTKLMNNAQRISQEIYDYTNRLVCLLKSINFVENN